MVRVGIVGFVVLWFGVFRFFFIFFVGVFVVFVGLIVISKFFLMLSEKMGIARV